MSELSTQDRRIVEGTLQDVKPEDVPRLRKIHEDALRELRPQYEAIRRAIAMREAALERLEPSDVLDGRRAVWVEVILPPADNDPAQAIRERRWVDADGNQWRTNDQPLTPAPIVGDTA